MPVTVTGTGFTTDTVEAEAPGVTLTSPSVTSKTTITAKATVTATAALGPECDGHDQTRLG